MRQTLNAFCRVGRELWMDLGGRTPGARLGGKPQKGRTDWPRHVSSQTMVSLLPRNQPATCSGQGGEESGSTAIDKGCEVPRIMPQFCLIFQEASRIGSKGATRRARLHLPQKNNILYMSNVHPSLPSSLHQPCDVGSEQ